MASGWSVQQVLSWLERAVPSADGAVLHSFDANAIDGAALLELTSAELRDELGVARLGVRKAILREIAKLREGPPEADPPPAAADRAGSERQRRDAQDFLALARVTRDLVNFDAAIAALEAALELDPTNEDAQDDLEVARIEKGVVEAIDIDIGTEARRSVREHRIDRNLFGTGNNSDHPRWGRANEPLRRVAPAAYADGESQPAARVPAVGLNEATPRRISNVICKGESSPSRDGLSAFVWACVICSRSALALTVIQSLLRRMSIYIRVRSSDGMELSHPRDCLLRLPAQLGPVP